MKCPLCKEKLERNLTMAHYHPATPCSMANECWHDRAWRRLARQVRELKKAAMLPYANEIERLIKIEPLKSDAAMAGALLALAWRMKGKGK